MSYLFSYYEYSCLVLVFFFSGLYSSLSLLVFASFSCATVYFHCRCRRRRCSNRDSSLQCPHVTMHHHTYAAVGAAGQTPPAAGRSFAVYSLRLDALVFFLLLPRPPLSLLLLFPLFIFALLLVLPLPPPGIRKQLLLLLLLLWLLWL